MIPSLPDVKPGDFEMYLRAIRTSYARFVTTRTLRQKEESGGGSRRGGITKDDVALGEKGAIDGRRIGIDEQTHRESQLLATVPSVFFRDDYTLASIEAFEEILPSMMDESDNKVGELGGRRRNDENELDANVANGAVLAQEQLGHYLDLIESVILKRVGDRADAFLDAMLKTRKLAESVDEAKRSVIDLRTSNRRSFRRAAHATARVKEASRRRDNVLRLAETLKEIENIRLTKVDVDVLLESGEYSECLEAIEECERSLRTASNNSANAFSCFSNLSKDLELIKRKCTGAITAELCSRSRVDSNFAIDEVGKIASNDKKYKNDETLIDNGNSYDVVEYEAVCESILPPIRGLLRSSSTMPMVDAVHAVSREIFRDLKRDVEKVCEKILKSSTSSSSEENMEDVYVALQKCSPERYVRTLDAVSRVMANMHFRRGKIIHDVFAYIFIKSNGFEESYEDTTTPPNASNQSPKFSLAAIKREVRDEANERFSKESVSKILLAIHEASSSIIEGGSMLYSRLLTCRKHVNAKLDTSSFTKVMESFDAFIRIAEKANKNGKRCVSLRSQVHSQARLFLNVKHAAELNKLKTLLEQESWSQATVPAHFQELLDCLVTAKTNDVKNQNSDANQPLPTKIIAKHTNTEHVATTTTLMLIRTLNEYIDVVESMPDLSADAARRIAELFGAFNDGACVLVLGAQAMQGANLRSITAKHLSVTQQSLRLFQSIAPVLKARLSEITATMRFSSEGGSGSGAENIHQVNVVNEDARRNLAFANLDKIGGDFETHCERIHLKLLEIIRERLRYHRGTLPQLAKVWESETMDNKDEIKQSQFSKGLIKELGTLSKVVRGMFQEEDQNNVLGVVALEFDSKLASSLKTVWEERHTFGGTVERRIKADCDALCECLSGLAGKFDSEIIGVKLKKLSEFVGESMLEKKKEKRKTEHPAALAKKVPSPPAPSKKANDEKDNDKAAADAM